MSKVSSSDVSRSYIICQRFLLLRRIGIVFSVQDMRLWMAFLLFRRSKVCQGYRQSPNESGWFQAHQGHWQRSFRRSSIGMDYFWFSELDYFGRRGTLKFWFFQDIEVSPGTFNKAVLYSVHRRKGRGIPTSFMSYCILIIAHLINYCKYVSIHWIINA